MPGAALIQRRKGHLSPAGLPLDGGPGPRHTVGAFPIFRKNPAFPQWPFRKINDRAIVAYGRPLRALLAPKRGWSRTTSAEQIARLPQCARRRGVRVHALVIHHDERHQYA